MKLEGDKLTGTVVSGRGDETAITDGTVKGDEISFTVIRERNNEKFTQRYNGKISGDTIKGKTELKRAEGEARTRDWEANREAAAAAKPPTPPAGK